MKVKISDLKQFFGVKQPQLCQEHYNTVLSKMPRIKRRALKTLNGVVSDATGTEILKIVPKEECSVCVGLSKPIVDLCEDHLRAFLKSRSIIELSDPEFTAQFAVSEKSKCEKCKTGKFPEV